VRPRLLKKEKQLPDDYLILPDDFSEGARKITANTQQRRCTSPERVSPNLEESHTGAKLKIFCTEVLPKIRRYISRWGGAVQNSPLYISIHCVEELLLPAAVVFQRKIKIAFNSRIPAAHTTLKPFEVEN